MLSLLPSIAILGLVAFASLLLTRARPSPGRLGEARARASHMLALATVLQGGHFVEEWATGFHVRFPALFGLEPMPLPFFVTLNVTWLLAWTISITMLRAARQPAFFAAWFLAIAAVLNGVAHPVLAVAAGGYFPGLASSPFVGLAGLGLWHRLRSATARHG